jgi:REP element-mobilizing transposase RayT
MKFDPDKHHRRSIRLKGYDYRKHGAYFVTICTVQRACIFGEIVNDSVFLNTLGEIATEEWLKTGKIRESVEIDHFVVMPNHIHGIIVILDVDSARVNRRLTPTGSARSTNNTREWRGTISGSLNAIVQQYKSAVTKLINRVRETPGAPVWQRNYYEHIIRNEAALNSIRQYIDANPINWALDRENPKNAK